MNGHASAFQYAFKKYREDLSKDPKRGEEFRWLETTYAQHHATGVEDLHGSISEIETACTRSKLKTKAGPILRDIVHGLSKYRTTIDTLVSAYPMPLALVWGSMKMVLDLSSSFLEVYESVHKHMITLAGQLRSMQVRDRVFQDVESIQEALVVFHVALLRFWYLVYRLCTKRRYRTFGAFSAASKVQEGMEDISSAVSDVNRLVEDEGLKQGHESKKQDTLSYLKGWIGGDNRHHLSMYKDVSDRLHHGVGHWIFDSPIFIKWKAGNLKPSSLWLSAEPGSGKTFLCTSIIRQIKEDMPSAAVAFLYCSMSEHPDYTQMLRDIASQLFHNFMERQPSVIPNNLLSYGCADPADRGKLQDFVQDLTNILGTVYVVLDGLDEAGDQIAPLIRFFEKDAGTDSQVRLFLSSQPLSPRSKIVSRAEKIEIPRKASDTQIDQLIASFLGSQFLSSSEDMKNRIREITVRVAEGNVLLANNILDSLDPFDSDEANDTALNSIPSTSYEYYKRMLLKLLGNERSRETNRIILSLVVFAERQLLVPELLEALAIVRTASNKNLHHTAIPDPKLIDDCSPLIRRTGSTSESDRQTVMITHSVAHHLLKDFSNENEGLNFNTIEERPRLTGETIANACLKYLFQPRFSRLLKKHSPSRFHAGDYDIAKQRFSVYAAKYWNKHMNCLEATTTLQDLVAGFVKSPNYLTTMQIQSLFVEGHFIERRDPRGCVELTKRVWPEWFANNDEGRRLHSDYCAFIDEWAELLRLGISRRMNGEINRIFWGALGQNFLALQMEEPKYRSYGVGNNTKEGTDQGVIQYHEALSPDGKTMTVVKSSPSSSDPLSIPDELEIEVFELGGDAPKLNCSYILPVDSDVVRSNYWAGMEGSRSFPLIPNSCGFTDVNALNFSSDGRLLRYSNRLYAQISSDADKFRPIRLEEPGKYWDLVEATAKYLVLARRCVPKINDNNYKLDDSDSFSEDSFPSSDESIEAELVLSDESKSSKSSSSFDDDYSGSGDLSSSNYSFDNSVSDIATSSSEAETDYESSSSSSGDDYPAIVRQKYDSFCDLCRRSQSPSFIHCKVCKSKNLKSWNMCEQCFRAGNWCSKKSHVLERFTLRLGKKETLERRIMYTRIKAQQTMQVYDMSLSPPRLLARILSTEKDSMHGSPPIIHPKLPLVVWFQSQSKLLFTDPDENTYFIIPIPTSRHWKRICAFLNFSECGGFLRIIFFETEPQRRTVRRNVPKGPDKNSRPEIILHATVFQLSDSKPTKRRPTLFHYTSCTLGTYKQDLISRLPFSVTWSADKAYVTMNGTELQLWQVALFPNNGPGLRRYRRAILQGPGWRANGTADEPWSSDSDNDNDDMIFRKFRQSLGRLSGIKVPQETILLPTSAAKRTVYFFPANQDDTEEEESHHKLVIGRRADTKHERPMVIYLSERDLGSWMELEDKKVTVAEEARMRLSGQIEHFDVSNDCDIEVFRTF